MNMIKSLSRVAHQDLPNRFSSWLRPLKGPGLGAMFWSPLWVTLLLRAARTSGHWREAWRQGRHRADGAMIKTWLVSQSIFIDFHRSYGHICVPIVRYCKISFRIPRPQFLLGQIVNTHTHIYIYICQSCFSLFCWFQVRFIKFHWLQGLSVYGGVMGIPDDSTQTVWSTEDITFFGGQKWWTIHGSIASSEASICPWIRRILASMVRSVVGSQCGVPWDSWHSNYGFSWYLMVSNTYQGLNPVVSRFVRHKPLPSPLPSTAFCDFTWAWLCHGLSENRLKKWSTSACRNNF